MSNITPPPPHLLKKFSEQAREDSKKRGHPGYCKTFAILCIDWAFREAAMNDYRFASAEVSGAASQPGSSSEIERRSDIVLPPELDITVALVQQWFADWESSDNEEVSFAEFVIPHAAQWGADQELEACCEWLGDVDCDDPQETAKRLLRARRPKPPSLREQALTALTRYTTGETILTNDSVDTIRRAIEALPDDH